MSGQVPERTENTAVTLVSGGGASASPMSFEGRRRLVAESLGVGNPGNNARELPAHADPRQDCHVELSVEDIRPYERNPRHVTNAKFSEIKESIRACGIRNPVTVTRRPGERNFIIEAGGNTRLRAIQELWAETRESRFQKMTVLFRPWRSESHVLTAHLIENEQRGEMTFWDKANGVVALKAQLEAEQERTLSLKHLEAELKGIGMSVNTATLSHYLFATDRLRILGEAVTGLSGLDVKTTQPRLNALKRYAQLREPIEEAALYTVVFEPVFQTLVEHYRQTRVFDASVVCDACEEALAGYLREPVAHVRTALDEAVRPPRETPGALTLHACKDEKVRPAEVTARTRAPPDRDCAVDIPGAATADSETRHGPPDADVHPANQESAIRLIEKIQRLADLVGIGECLRLHPAAPYGYLVRALPNRDEAVVSQRLRHRAWCLLAVVSGQVKNSSLIPFYDDSCAAHSAANADVDRVDKEALKTIVLDDGFLPWLLDTQDDAADTFWHIVTLVRGLRSATAPPDVLAGPRPEKTGTA